MPEDQRLQLLQNTWVHSHEEDEGDRRVYRVSGFPFPPSRGRAAVTLLPDGVAEARYPGADDRARTAPGTWSLEGSVLRIEAPGWPDAVELVTVDESVLVVRNIGKES